MSARVPLSAPSLRTTDSASNPLELFAGFIATVEGVLTSPARSSSATAPHLPDADHPVLRVIELEISRLPYKERACMPGSQTPQGQVRTCDIASAHVAFR